VPVDKRADALACNVETAMWIADRGQDTDFGSLTDPNSTALVVIDVQNDFCHADGAFGRVGHDNARMPALAAALHKLLAEARARQVFTVFVRATYDREVTSRPLAQHRRLHRTLEIALAVRRALGVRGGEVSHLSPQNALALMKSHDFDLVAVRPLRWPPSAMTLVWRTGAPYNLFGYSNPVFDRAVDEGDWRAAEAALREDPPAAFVCTRVHLAVADVKIKNPVLGPYDPLETLPEWEIAQ